MVRWRCATRSKQTHLSLASSTNLIRCDVEQAVPLEQEQTDSTSFRCAHVYSPISLRGNPVPSEVLADIERQLLPESRQAVSIIIDLSLLDVLSVTPSKHFFVHRGVTARVGCYAH